MTDDEAVAGPDTPEGDKVAPDAPEKSYDELLAEFDTAPVPVPVPVAEPDTASELAALKAQVSDMGDQLTSNTREEAFTKTVVKFRESDTLNHLSDRAIKGWINQRALEDKRINEAYGTSSWEGVQRKMIAEMESEFSGIPSQSDNDTREAAEAAARGVSTTAPPKPGRKTAQEEIDMGFNDPKAWEAYKRSMGA